MAQLTLWFLNRINVWDHATLVEALGGPGRVKLGTRIEASGADGETATTVDVAANHEDELGAPGELMHEGHGLPTDRENADPTPTKYDEYFFPIPDKCLGKDQEFWKRIASAEGQQRLAEIEAHEKGRAVCTERIKRREEERQRRGLTHEQLAKTTIGRRFGEVQMNLGTGKENLGYYQMLHRATAVSGARNVLIGYSQGGTVARYLAFLDEHVVAPQHRCIHGVITVQAPNRGSPLACPNKARDISRAIVEVAASILQWLPARSTAGAGNGGTTGDALRSLDEFLKGEIKDDGVVRFINHLLDHLLDSASGDDERTKKLVDAWETARKWLSGVSGVPSLAFWDIDPDRLAEPGSVLHSINSHHLREVLHGAVIGTDFQIDALIFYVLSQGHRFLSLVARLLGRPIHAHVEQARGIVCDTALSFPQSSKQALEEIAQAYDMGAGTGGALELDKDIPARAHDFVIPSVSQLLVPHTPAHLGNYVNPNASHLTGAARDGETSDVDAVCGLLKQLQLKPAAL